MANKSVKNNSNDLVITINKEKVVNTFFICVLVFAFIAFIFLLGRGIYRTVHVVETELSDEVNTELLSAYYDNYLDIYYAVPGGDWGMAMDDGIEPILQRVTQESQGQDGYFDILGDMLTEEVLSSMWLESIEKKQYVSYAFKPNSVYNSQDRNDFITFCTETLKSDLASSDMEQLSTVDYTYDLYYTEMDELGGVLMKMKVINTYQDEETGELKDIEMYLMRYSVSLGVNVLDITYGCVNEDETIVPYLKYFAKSLIPNLSLETTMGSVNNNSNVVDTSEFTEDVSNSDLDIEPELVENEEENSEEKIEENTEENVEENIEENIE